jgi:hypothetical protein
MGDHLGTPGAVGFFSVLINFLILHFFFCSITFYLSVCLSIRLYLQIFQFFLNIALNELLSLCSLQRNGNF